MPPTDLHALTTYPNLGRYTGASNRSLSILLTCAWRAHYHPISRIPASLRSPLRYTHRAEPLTQTAYAVQQSASNVAASTTCFILRNSYVGPTGAVILRLELYFAQQFPHFASGRGANVPGWDI
jgi:hypothetical protein